MMSQPPRKRKRSATQAIAPLQQQEQQQQLVPVAAAAKRPKTVKKSYMRFRTNHVESLCNIFQTCRGFLVSVTIRFTENGFRMCNIDSNDIMMVNLEVTKDTLEAGSYECNTNYMIGIDIQTLATWMKMGKKSNEMEFYLEGDEPTELAIHFYTYDEDGKTAVHTEQKLKLSIITTLEFNILPVEYHQSISMQASSFKEAICNFKGYTAFSAIVLTRFYTEEPDGTRTHEFRMEVKEDLGTIATSFIENHSDDPETPAAHDLKFHRVHENEETQYRAAYRLKNIVAFTKLKAAVFVQIFLAEAADPENNVKIKPLKLEYRCGGIGTVSFYLAPKIEDDE